LYSNFILRSSEEASLRIIFCILVPFSHHHECHEYACGSNTSQCRFSCMIYNNYLGLQYLIVMIHNDLSTRKGKTMNFAKMYMVSFFIPICRLAGSTMMVWIIQIWIDTGNRLDFLTNTNPFNIDEAMNLFEMFWVSGSSRDAVS
jgi:hypothetical protein